MSTLLLGKVFYDKDKKYFAGYLREEPGDRTSFTYDEEYLNAALPPIAHSLPLRTEPFINQVGLLPFFDNLVAEGWLEKAQSRFLGKMDASRFELLLAFGQDCAGAVSSCLWYQCRDHDPIRSRPLACRPSGALLRGQ